MELGPKSDNVTDFVHNLVSDNLFELYVRKLIRQSSVPNKKGNYEVCSVN